MGYAGGKTILDDYLREVRPLFDRPRTFQRTVYRPCEICQFDLWEPRAQIPVGHGQTRRGWVVVACLGYSRTSTTCCPFEGRIFASYRERATSLRSAQPAEVSIDSVAIARDITARA